MAKFNAKQKPIVTTTQTHQGGVGYKQNEKLELISLLATGIDNTYYEKESDRTIRLKNLIDSLGKQDPIFAAKALVYARTKMGQRSVTHLGATYLAPHLSGNSITTRFFTKRSKNKNEGGLVYRLDDIMEITSAYFAKNPAKGKRNNGQPSYKLPNALKRGFKLAIEAADEYELSKYQAKTRSLSLVDMFNLVHPKPKDEKMKSVFKQLVEGTLKQKNTVEDKNSKAGQDVATKIKTGEITKEQASKELQEIKEDNYQELIQNRKIGYIALLRNLRNILKNSSDKTLINSACELLTDVKMIKQSLVWPHQIDLALEIMLLEFNASQMAPFITALSKAYELAIPNLTDVFTGRTAVVFDTSGSMHSESNCSNGDNSSRKTFNKTPIEKAALIGATLAKGTNADLFQFGTTCALVKYNPSDSMNTIKNTGLSQNGKVGHGTSFESIFETLSKHGSYNRVFIISDMQGGDSIARNSSYQSYVKKHGQPTIYTIDLVGYGTSMFKQDSKIMQLYGYSSSIYESIKSCEIDYKAVLKEIEAINI